MTLGCHFQSRRLFLDRHLGSFAYHVDGPVARDRRHPRNWRRQPRIELPGAVPDLDVGLLNDLLSELLPRQDTEHNAKKFRACRGIEAFESRLIALCHRGNQPDELRWRLHSVPRNHATSSLVTVRSSLPEPSYH